MTTKHWRSEQEARFNLSESQIQVLVVVVVVNNSLTRK